jgi:hypothetical protein
MPYQVQFVGLVCFYKDGRSRQALLPDGREPGHGIEPHAGSVEVDPKCVIEAAGWGVSKDTEHGRYLLPPCSIVIEGAEADSSHSGDLDTSQHEGRLPMLSAIDRNFEIDPDRAETIARVRIQRGVLAAYRIPGGTASISQLQIPHDGEIHIRVLPRDDSPERRLLLKPGTEVVIANMGRSGYLTNSPHNSHFRIYEKLSTQPVTLHEPEILPDVPPSLSQHVTFQRHAPISLSSDCTNTGCCRP